MKDSMVIGLLTKWVEKKLAGIDMDSLTDEQKKLFTEAETALTNLKDKTKE
jgi:hypothetical protein